MKPITKEQYDKLIDCEVLQSDFVTWVPRKFYSRGFCMINVASETKTGEILISAMNYSLVRVNGITLRYIPKYSFTNPKNPFQNK
jgi:hypothetical protein